MPEAVAGVRIGDALAEATVRLAEAGCDTPQLDASLLLASVLGVGRERLVLDHSAGLDAAAVASFDTLVRRRVAREPVAYILGRRDFRRLSLAVDRRVLIPRPETELLVEAGLGLPSGALVADVGTGSGAVALALKDERPDLDVVGIDVSADALEVARGNAARLGLDVRFVQADLLDGGSYDTVFANLPYVAVGDARLLAPEITRYEPEVALYAGVDGLEVVRRLLGRVHGIGFVALEVGFDQAEEVSRLVVAAGFASVERLRDLAGHERVVVGRR